MDEKYPYLGLKEFDGKKYVVLFTEEDKGIVVMTEFENEDIKFGTIGNFDENDFIFLPQDQCVRLSN